MKTLVTRLSSLVVALAALAAAADPATNAPAEPPAIIVRFASIDSAEKTLRGIVDAIGMSGRADDMIRSMRQKVEETGCTDSSRPIVLATCHPFDGGTDGLAAAFPGEEPSAERIGRALELAEGETPVRGADGVWSDPDDDGEETVMLHRDGYNVFASPREYLAYADTLLATAAEPRFPGAAVEVTFRAEAFRKALDARDSGAVAALPLSVSARLFERCEAFSFGLAFDESAGLLLPFSATPPASNPDAFADFAAAPALDPATALWSDEALGAYAASDTGRAFGAFFDFYASFFAEMRDELQRNLRDAGLDEAAASATLAADIPEMCRLCKRTGAMSGYVALAPDGTLSTQGVCDYGDPATAREFRELQRGMFAKQSPTNLSSFAETADGWSWNFNPFAAMPTNAAPAGNTFLASLRRIYGPRGMHGEARLVPGTAATYRFRAGASGGEEAAIPAGRLSPGALERFAPGAKPVACMQMRLVDFIRASLDPDGEIPAGMIPSGGRIRWDLGVRNGAPAGLLAVDPAELRAYASLLFFSVTTKMAPAAPAPSGEDALFDD